MYKGISKYTLQWVYGSLLDNVIALTGEHDINGHMTIDYKTPFTAIVDNVGSVHEIIHETKCQYAGKKDKNDKKIYEGDMLKFKRKNNELVTVIWRDDGFYTPVRTSPNATTIYSLHNFLEKYQCEIVNNIHDNKEGKE